ncbi:MAG: ChbG/HpnK family deacetylase [Gammaproteobacteria bacterium]
MKKRIVLCADDYGQALAISQGILALIKQGRLTATSCLVNTPYWEEHAKWLLPFKDQVDIGLHFNLTEGKPLSEGYRAGQGPVFYSVNKLLALTFLRRVSQSAIEAECHAQIDQFEAAIGFLPRNIYGNQHVHQFPVIRDALLNVYEQRLRASNAYIRLANETPDFCLKKIIIYASGAAALKKQLRKRAIPHNASFAGIYPFHEAHEYPVYFTEFLQKIGDKGLIMCHPGLETVELDDPIGAARVKEYDYFAGQLFVDECARQSVELGRLEY